VNYPFNESEKNFKELVSIEFIYISLSGLGLLLFFNIFKQW